MYNKSDRDKSSDAFFAKKEPVAHVDDNAKVTGRLTRIGEQLAEEDEDTSAQRMRRRQAFQDMFTNMVNRDSAGAAPNTTYVTWEEFESMHSEYKQCLAEDGAKAAGRFSFQPLAAYHHKLIREGKAPLRPILQGEVGMWLPNTGETRIILLKDQGPGDKGGKEFRVGIDFKDLPKANIKDVVFPGTEVKLEPDETPKPGFLSRVLDKAIKTIKGDDNE